MGMAIRDYAQYDGLGLAELVAKKKVKPIELLDEAIVRAERLNPALNAIIFKDYERARDVAKGKLPRGIFTGVPFLLKDIMAFAQGMPTRQGAQFLPPLPWPHNSFLAAKFKKAGLVIFGKTNVPEFGLVPTTESRLYGAARNPWNLEHSTGGSSGGAAAAVAAGIVPLAHANDGGGSIRIPASCCGLVGLKPTRGRMSFGPDFADSIDGLGVDLVVSRSVRDTAASLDAVAGYMPGDPYCATPPPGSYLDGMKRKTEEAAHRVRHKEAGRQRAASRLRGCGQACGEALCRTRPRRRGSLARHWIRRVSSRASWRCGAPISRPASTPLRC